MSETTENGLRLQANLTMGYNEVGWAQAEVLERRGVHALAAAWAHGWVGGFWSSGRPDFGWGVDDDGADGLTLVMESTPAATPFPRARARDASVPYIGIDQTGRVLELVANALLLDENGDRLVVPNDGVTRTLLAHYGTRVLEPGTLTLTSGSTSVVGVGTQFTRHFSSPRKDVLLITAADSGAGNEGTYQISTITDDTHLTVDVPLPSTEAGVTYRIQGRFQSAVPASPEVHNHATVWFELVTRTGTLPTTGLIVADITRTAGVTAVFMRQGANVYVPVQPFPRSLSFVAGVSRSHAVSTAPFAEGAEDVYATSIGESVVDIAVAPAKTGADKLGSDTIGGALAAIAVFDGATTVRVVIREWAPATRLYGPWGGWRNPNNNVSEITATTGQANSVALVALPAGARSGVTHLLFHSDTGGGIYLKTTSNNGLTWAAGGLIVGDVGATGVSALLSRTGRLWLVWEGTGLATPLVYGYSDDYGVTWDSATNAGDGTALTAETGTNPVLAEDFLGNIHVAWRDGNDIYLGRGGAAWSPVPDAGEPPALIANDEGYSITRSSRIALVAAADGAVLAGFVSAVSTDYAYLDILSCARGDVVGVADQPTVSYQDVAGADANPYPCAAYRSGANAFYLVRRNLSSLDKVVCLYGAMPLVEAPPLPNLGG